MNIAFYANHPYWSQLNNNGGTRTILKSVQALNALGHKACVVATKDRFTWFSHPKPVKKIPKDTDVCIAVSISDIKPMIEEAQRRCPKAKLAYWMRSMELHQMPNEKIMNKLRKFQKIGKVIVNASHLSDWLIVDGVDSEVVFAGLDEWSSRYRFGRMEDGRHVRSVGCLYNTRHKTKHWDHFQYIMKEFGDKYDYFAFGTPKTCKDKNVNYYSNPSREKIEYIYQRCDIWFSPSVSEGFHNVPAEANLCGSLVCGVHHPHSGTRDFLSNETGMVYRTLDEAVQMIQNPDYSKVAKMQLRLATVINGRKANMEKLVEVLDG